MACEVGGVSTEYGTTAQITCNYTYYVGGTVMRGVGSCSVEVGGSGSGGSASGGYSYLYCQPEEFTPDMATDGSRGKTIFFDSSRELESRLRYANLRLQRWRIL